MKLASNRLMESESPLLNLATNFQWTNEDQNHVAAQIEEGIDPSEVAKSWVNSNEEKVKNWLQAKNK